MCVCLRTGASLDSIYAAPSPGKKKNLFRCDHLLTDRQNANEKCSFKPLRVHFSSEAVEMQGGLVLKIPLHS